MSAGDESGIDRRNRTVSLPVLGQDGPLPGRGPGGPTTGPGHDDAAGTADPPGVPRSPGSMDRRHALKVMAIAAAAPTLASCGPSAEDGAPPVDMAGPSRNPNAAGTAWDPDLVDPSVPWSRQLGSDELATLAALCDVIIPADDRSPSASAVGAHEFIDEWVSAPYEGNARDQVLIRGGLVWIDREASTRFAPAQRFRELSDEQQRAICDDICYTPDVAPGHESAARFFDRMRDLTSTAFWTTTEGMADLQYVGNVPLPRWDPPPPEVLRHIGIE